MANKKNQTVNALKQKGAKYNPRHISDAKLKALKKALNEFGDLGGVVFNVRTQTMVSGHQRVKAIPRDAEIIIKERYDLPTRTGTVAVGSIIIDGEPYSYREVDWDEYKEKQANIAANAHGGDWDDAMLNDLLKNIASEAEQRNIDVDIDLIGFDFGDVMQICGQNPFNAPPETLVEIAESMREAGEKIKEIKKKIEEVNVNILNSYLVVVFKDYPMRKSFTDALNLPDNRYIDGRLLLSLLDKQSEE